MFASRPILLTGSTGQIGSALLPLVSQLCPVAAPAREALDLSDASSVRAAVRAARPRWIINSGAYTAVDRAESEPALAFAVNAEALRILGEEARALGIPVLHLSTDYVFNGEGDRPWRESDATGPLNVYGASKLAGEEALAASGAAYLTLRTSWVYDATGQNFLRTMLRRGREQARLRVVDDQYGTPTAAQDVANVIVHLLRHFDEAGQADVARARQPETSDAGAVERAVRSEGGIVHAAGSGDAATWFGFAQAIFAHAATLWPGVALAALEPVPTSAYPTPARRPHNSRLDCALLAARFGCALPEWRTSLASVMSAMATGGAAAAVTTVS